jgi:FkbM family methyltransferase
VILKEGNFKDFFVATLKYIWNGFIRWPVLVWKIRGQCEVQVCPCRETPSIKLAVSVFENASLYSALNQKKIEPDVFGLLCGLLKEGDVFFDVGAYYGFYALTASKLVGPSGRVFAFEPDYLARRKITRNIELNKVDNVHILPFALSGDSGKKFLVAKVFGASVSRISGSSVEGSEKRAEVVTTTLDEFVEENGRMPNVVKIDVEGHEDEVLRGGAEVLRQDLTVLLEFHRKELMAKHVDPEAFFHQLFRLNKRVFFLTEEGIMEASEDTSLENWPSSFLILAAQAELLSLSFRTGQNQTRLGELST